LNESHRYLVLSSAKDDCRVTETAEAAYDACQKAEGFLFSFASKASIKGLDPELPSVVSFSALKHRYTSTK
jgi:hypothetical protein